MRPAGHARTRPAGRLHETGTELPPHARGILWDHGYVMDRWQALPRVERYALLLLAVLLAVSLFLTARGDVRPTLTHTATSHSVCRDYDTWQDAQDAFLAGAYWLDRDGDGRACESLP